MSIYHKQYKRIHDNAKYFFYINSDQLEENTQWIHENKIENIRLSQYDGYKIKTIEPILRLKHIKSLAIFIEDVDLSKLCELKELEDLSIGELNFNVDVSNLHDLKEFYLLYHKNVKGLDTLKALEKLIVVKGDSSLFTEELFSKWSQLNELALLSPKLPQDLSFLGQLKKLQELEINNSRSKFSVADLTLIKESLQILKIGNCKKVEGIEEVLKQLKNLKWLTFTDSITLKDTTFVNFMPRLETLIVLGSSYFENGNLTNLEGKLKHVSIDDKKHYNLKYKDFTS